MSNGANRCGRGIRTAEVGAVSAADASYPSRAGLAGVALFAVAGVGLVALRPAIRTGVEVTDGAVLDPVVAGVALWAGVLAYFLFSLRAEGVRKEGARGPFGPGLGVANAVTLLRGGLYAVVGGFLLVAPTSQLAWVPAACYGAGVVLDRLDGYLARTVDRETELGRRLDMAFDTFGFVVAPAVAVAWGRLPVWYLSLSAARYLFRGALAWRRWRGLPVYDFPDSDLGKWLAGGQMLFLTVALLPAVPAGAVGLVAPLALAPSLGGFLRDYLHAAGHLGPAGREGAPAAGDD
jgi:CDP-diacylglycerol--glycerol-3-phosphate 3-phosphatidyltransferase